MERPAHRVREHPARPRQAQAAGRPRIPAGVHQELERPAELPPGSPPERQEVVSYRAGSGKDFSRNECAGGTGWLPSGTYEIERHTTSRGADAKPWNQPAVQGYVIELADKVCKPVSGQTAVNRTELFIHSEMKADGTQGFSIFEDDSLRRWEDERDYKSSGCIKLAPNHIKDLFAHLDQVGRPKGLALQVS